MYWIALQPRPEPALGDALSDPVTVLGWWALQYTPRVACLADVVLLEVSASERLWGGRATLLRSIYTSSKPIAHVAYARGATSLLALGRLIAGQKALFPADELPLLALLAARPHLGTLARMGCTTWGQLRALPRGGLARRFGADLLAALDQAYGERPDVYPWLSLPDVFDSRLALVTQVESADALLFGARRLLAQLQAWLQLRQLGVLAIELGWRMDPRRNTATEGSVLIRTAQASADMLHLQRLLAERLAQVELAAPVQSLCLRTIETQARHARSASLLPAEQLKGDSLLQTLERLSARLGCHKVLRLQTCADHRPEHRQAWVAATSAPQSIATFQGDKRAGGQKSLKNSGGMSGVPTAWASTLLPTWLLAEPIQLVCDQQIPCFDGPLTLLIGPQRLEAGWWPDPTGKVADTTLRDYFVARNPGTILVWIYRERLLQGRGNQTANVWYLHGIFA
ncbi:DNA polymerase Y family protein [Rhodoferax sp.]|uniref:Y-family DNA polymerase n=1 Tax=Rhodoferax sp. TaxID=50421 RepID=UPI0025E8C04D|nr:DNA polymerase Y family protein [Rhodoferax sp.]